MKYIITVKFPSGAQWAFSSFKGDFALVPIVDGKVRMAFSFDSAQEAQRHLNKQLKCAPAIERMGPFHIVMMEMPQ